MVEKEYCGVRRSHRAFTNPQERKGPLARKRRETALGGYKAWRQVHNVSQTFHPKIVLLESVPGPPKEICIKIRHVRASETFPP